MLNSPKSFETLNPVNTTNSEEILTWQIDLLINHLVRALLFNYTVEAVGFGRGHSSAEGDVVAASSFWDHWVISRKNISIAVLPL